MPRYTVHLAPSGFTVVDGQGAGVVEYYSQRFKALARCDELNGETPRERYWRESTPLERLAERNLAPVNVPTDDTDTEV